MNLIPLKKDLIVLAADKNIESAVIGLLGRESLGIRTIKFDIFVHRNRDPGCLHQSAQFLRNFINQYQYALVMFDRDGCGKPDSRENLELDVEQRLIDVGWQHRSTVIVLDPELEVWVWSHSLHVPESLGWQNQTMSLRSWMIEQNHLEENHVKPPHPKDAMEAVLKQVRKPRSSSIYLQLAQKVSLRGHLEPAFVKFQTTLQTWFPKETV